MDMIKRGLALLKEKADFRHLMGAQFSAQAGDGLVQGALAAVIAFGGQKGFDLEGARNPDEILRIALYIFVPYTILSPFLGVVIDRWDRRRLLFVANGIRAVILAGVAVLALASGSFDELPDAVLFLSLLLTLSATRVVLATKSAALPVTLQETSLVEGNALSQLGGAILGLAAAGVALVGKKIIGAEAVVLLGAAVYGIGAVFARLMQPQDPDQVKTSFGQELARVAGNIMAGIREVSRNPKAGAAIATYFWLRFLWSFTAVGIALIARELLADDELLIAILIGGAGAAGAALGFVLAARLTDRVRATAQLVLVASVVAGLGVALLGALDLSISLALLTFFLGLGFFLAKISLDTMVQEALGNDFRGRAFSLYDIAYNLAWVVAAALMKVFWPDDNNGGFLIAIVGVVFLVGVGLLGNWFRGAGLLRGAEAPQPVRQ
ncbi:MAG: MFS transporter [Actinomycetota bacterium]|nr:MFS transporter [Actinomycetota bacterium]